MLLRPDEVSRAVELFAEKFQPPQRCGQPANVSFFRLSPSDIQFIEGSEGNGRDQEIGVDYPRDAVYSVFRDLPGSDPRPWRPPVTWNVEPGSVVARQGAPADKFFIIVEGEVDVVREDDGEERRSIRSARATTSARSRSSGTRRGSRR